MAKPQRLISAVQAVDILKEYEAGFGLKELAEKYKVSRMTISRTITRQGGNTRAGGRPSRYTAEVTQLICKQYEAGATLRDLAMTYGGDYSNIAQLIKRNGGKLRAQGRPRMYKKGILSWLDS